MKRPPALGRTTARGLIPFRGEAAAQLIPQARLSGPMPWVIAIMVALTVIAAAGGLALANVASHARAELAGGATVQIVEALPAERERQARVAEDTLAQSPLVAATRRVPQAEMDRLLEPWLGTGTDEEAVPIPALIDVQLTAAASEERIEQLRALLARVAPAARIDAQSSWLAPVFSALNSLRLLAAVLVLLLALTSAAAVWLAARTALGTNRDTIEIVHLLGGTDRQIAQIFERSVGFDATLGGTVGLALGLGAILLIGRQFGELGSGMMAGGALGWADWVLLAAIPLGGIVIAVLTARLTVLGALRRML